MPEKRSALLVLNGAPCTKELASAISSQVNYTACTDGAVSWYSNYHLPVDLVAGDLDSAPYTMPEEAEILPLMDQDFTDFEKTLKILIQREFRKIYILGGMGGEYDHSLSNLIAMGSFADQVSLVMINDNQRIRVVSDKKFRFSIKPKTKPIVSIFGWPKVTFKESSGLKYPLKGLTFDFQCSGSRNTAVSDRVVLELKEGRYLLIVNDNPLDILNLKNYIELF